MPRNSNCEVWVEWDGDKPYFVVWLRCFADAVGIYWQRGFRLGENNAGGN